MDSRVDAAAGTVVVEGERFPFELDACTGAAIIALGNGRWTVRPLLWREKRVLSSFAHLGLPFLKKQLMAVAVEGALSGDQAHDAALCALAVWVNAPGAGDQALPLDPVELASATLDVCRTLELAPAALDDRPAMEVEMLARAIRERELSDWKAPSDETRSPSPGVTRIDVVPDPVSSDSAEEVTEERPARRDETVIEDRAMARAAEDAPAGESTPNERETPPFERPKRAVPSARARGRFPTVRVFEPKPPPTQTPAPEPVVERNRKEERVGSPPAARETRSAMSTLRPGPSGAAFRAEAARSATVTTAAPRADRIANRIEAPAPLPRSRFEARAATAAKRNLSPSEFFVAEPSRPLRPVSPPSQPASPSREGMEAIVEELSERLEQAAFEMGVLPHD